MSWSAAAARGDWSPRGRPRGTAPAAAAATVAHNPKRCSRSPTRPNTRGSSDQTTRTGIFILIATAEGKFTSIPSPAESLRATATRSSSCFCKSDAPDLRATISEYVELIVDDKVRILPKQFGGPATTSSTVSSRSRTSTSAPSAHFAPAILKSKGSPFALSSLERYFTNFM